MSKWICALTVILFPITFVFASTPPSLIRQKVEQLPACEGLLRVDSHFVFTKSSARRLLASELNSNQVFELQTDHHIVDVHRFEDTLFVLTSQGLEAWNLDSRTRTSTHRTATVHGSFQARQNPTGLAAWGSQLVISHGRLGVSIFDIPRQLVVAEIPLTQQQLPLESMATGVTIQNGIAYVVMDNFHLVPPGRPTAFRGLVLIDIGSKQVLSELPGLDPGADAVTSDSSSLIVSFSGMALWQYELSSLRGPRLPEPVIRVSDYKVEERPTGKASLDDRFYYTCAWKRDPEGSGFHTRHPLVLDRALLQLETRK